MLNRHLINLTPHDINVRMANEDAFFTIAPTGVVARCDTEYNTVEQITAGGDVFNLRERYFNEPRNLPAPQENTLFIVSRIVAEALANERDDLIFVDTTIRDDDNRIIGCEAFARWPVEDTYDCGCKRLGEMDDGVGCESCGYVSCLDCHHINSQSARTSEWKCYEGYGCNKGDEQ